MIFIGILSTVLFKTLGEFDVTAPALFLLFGTCLLTREVLNTLAHK